MKVLIVCNRLCYGGAERVGATIANGLFGRGYEVYVVADLFMPVTYKLRPGIKVLNLYREGKSKYAKQLSSFKLLRSYLKQYHPDVVIGIMWLAKVRAKMLKAFDGKDFERAYAEIHIAIEDILKLKAY